MNATQKLGLKILAYTVLVLGTAMIILGVFLKVRAPVATSPDIFLQLGNSSLVLSVAWSPDGKTLASGGYDGPVKLWDAGSGKELRTLSDHSADVYMNENNGEKSAQFQMVHRNVAGVLANLNTTKEHM